MMSKHSAITNLQPFPRDVFKAAPEAYGLHHPALIIEAGQRWRDEIGEARVLASAEGYAMLRRRRSNPFIASVDQMLRGEYGWTLIRE